MFQQTFARHVFGLALALFAANCFVFSFSHMKTMENVRVAFWVFFAPLIVLTWWLWVIKQRTKLCMLIVVLMTVVATRFFYGSFGILVGNCNALHKPNKPTEIHAVVLTETDSPRKGYVEAWFAEASSLTLEFDTNLLPPGNYTQELNYTGGACEKALRLTKLLAYTVRVRRLLQNRTGDDGNNEWLLLLENDAELVYPSSFDHTLYCLAAYDTVDFIWLDFRNILADYSVEHSQMNVYAGGVAYLLRRASFPKLVAELRYNEETCALMDWPAAPDAIWGPACKRGALTCFTHVMFTEKGYPSTLGYDRDAISGDQRAGWKEFFFTSLACMVIAYATVKICMRPPEAPEIGVDGEEQKINQELGHT